LTLWFERNCAIENCFRVFKGGLVNVSDLICVHEAGIAHHVAAVGKVHRQNGPPAKLDIGGAMVVYCGVFRNAEVAPKEERLNSSQELRIGSHHVFKLSVFRTVLLHDDLTILFENLGLNLARVFIHQGFQSSLSGDNGITNFLYTSWAKTVSLARKTERRRRSFVGFQERARGPVRTDGVAFGESSINRLKSLPDDI